ncbi:hypothetical protein OAF54_00285 [bacterium]|nr:hypothetical protein [bacterium]
MEAYEKPGYVSYSELSELFDEMLNDCYEPITLFGQYQYDYGMAIRMLDPPLYREALLEYIDSMVEEDQLEEHDGNYYWKET